MLGIDGKRQPVEKTAALGSRPVNN